jgi:carotenoid cleavage dioxygenase-like enzyme
MKTGLASQKKLSASAVDFPRVNESYTGRYPSTFSDRRFWIDSCQ